MRKHDLTQDEILRAAAAYVAIERSDHKRWDDLEFEFQEAMKGVRCGNHPYWNSPIGMPLAVGAYARGLRRFIPDLSPDEAEEAIARQLVLSPARVSLNVLERYAAEVQA